MSFQMKTSLLRSLVPVENHGVFMDGLGCFEATPTLSLSVKPAFNCS